MDMSRIGYSYVFEPTYGMSILGKIEDNVYLHKLQTTHMQRLPNPMC